MYSNLDLYMMMHQEKLQEMERNHSSHRRALRESRSAQKLNRFSLRRLLFFL